VRKHAAHARIARRQGLDRGARAVAAVVVHQHELVHVVAVQLEQPRDQRADVHLLVVAGHDHRDRAPQGLVAEERHARGLGQARRLLRVQQDRAREAAH
jgi:hypothetical protein